MKLIRLIKLVLFYGFARQLPASDYPTGRWCRPVRRVICEGLFKYNGRDINIERGAFFGTGRQVSIGHRSGIGVDCKLYGPVDIGNDVMMGPEVVVYTTKHNVDRTDIPMIDQGLSTMIPVTIGNDVWIGRRVIILPGLTIGEGSIIGAGSIVTKNVAPYTVVAGSPARVIRNRKTV